MNNEEPHLETVLFQIAVFSRDSRKLLTSILSDVLSNDEVVVRFLKKNFSEHFAVLEQTLKGHLKVKKLSTPNINHSIRFLLGAVGVPNILFEVYERGGRKKHSPDSDNELKSRVKAAIIGLESGLCDKTK
jgi:hypothetical protein